MNNNSEHTVTHKTRKLENKAKEALKRKTNTQSQVQPKTLGQLAPDHHRETVSVALNHVYK